MKTRRAFTLIELLVVIAIIAILATLLFPVFGKSSMKGKAAVSMSNLKAWGVALNASLADFDNRMPFDGQGSGSPDMKNVDSWFNRLPPYLKEKPLNDTSYVAKPPRPGDKSIWINPAVPKSEGETYIHPPEKFLFCYAMNYFLSTSTDMTQPLNRVERPAATVFMAEKADDIANCNPKFIRAWFGDGDPATNKDNSAHFLFCDGHVELRKRTDFDPTMMPDTTDNPNSINNTKLNQHFTFVPYVGATSN